MSEPAPVQRGPAIECAARVDALYEWLLDARFGNGPRDSLLQFARFEKVALAGGLKVEGRRCMELGCGPNKPFSTASLLYLLGATSVLAIDTQPIRNAAGAAIRTHALLLAIAAGITPLTADPTQRRMVMSRLADFDLERLRKGDLKNGLPASIRYEVGDYRLLPEEVAKFDIALSFSVMEHVDDVRSLLSFMRARMSPDGAIFSDVDYRDHRLYTTKASPWQYLVDDDDVSPGYINKLRHSAMVETMESSGFEMLAVECIRATPPPAILSAIHPRHRHWSEDDLTIVSSRILMRSNDSAAGSETRGPSSRVQESPPLNKKKNGRP